MSANKTVTGLLLFAGTESVYNAGATLGPTTAVQVSQDLPQFNVQYVADGNRQGANFSGGQLRRVGPAGRNTTGEIRIEAKGLGAAYSSASTPPNLHPFLLASGLSGSLEGASWVYRPLPVNSSATSMALAVYDRGELLPVSGAYATFTVGAEGPVPAVFTFSTQGTAGVLSDVATPPARTFTAPAVVPPKNEGVSLSIGAFTNAIVRSWNYTHNLEIVARVNQQSTIGHAGFQIGRRTPVFTVTIEAPALSAYNPFADWEAGTPRAITLTVGSIANNRYVLSLPNACLTNVVRGNDGPVATLELTFEPTVTTPDANDDVVWSWT